MKKIFIFLSIIFSLFLVGCSNQTNPEVVDIKSTTNENISIESGKKTFMAFVATWCPHCQEEIPIFNEFYEKYSSEANLIVMVQDGKKFDGDYAIPQDITSKVEYSQVTGEKCGYVPSYVIFDENKNIIEKKCGGKVTLEELEEKLLSPGDYQITGFEEGDLGAIISTSKGDIEVRLFEKQAPKAVTNFLTLAGNNYYNDIIFHRVINDFMIQTGDPLGNGTGGQSIFGIKFEDEFSPDLKNIKGALAMANSGANTNGSQFFINQNENSHLDNVHTVFGQVINGLNIVNEIAGVETDIENKPLEEIKILGVKTKKFENGELKDFEFNNDELLKSIKEDKITDDSLIYFNYKIIDTDTNETLQDTAIQGNVAYKIGDLFVKIQNEIKGLKAGDKKTVDLKPEEAYGEYDDKLVETVEKSLLDELVQQGLKLEVGEYIPTQNGVGIITEVTDKEVSVDFNHPYVNKNLKFEFEILGVYNKKM